MAPHRSIEAGRSRWWLAESGFSLVELMAGLVIALVIVAAGFTTMTSTNKAAQANDQAANTQQNVRLAMELISGDIKMAGFGMSSPVGACNTAIVPADNTPAGADTGPDSVSIVVPNTSNVAPLWTLAVQATGPFNTITLQAGAVAAMQAAGLVVNGTVSIGGALSGTVTTIAGNVLTIANMAAGASVFPVGTPVYLLQCITYQIILAPDALNICAGNAPCLVRGVAPALNCNIAANPCAPIADGIEDIQLAYACDGCNVAVNGGIADRVVDDQNGSNTFDVGDFISNNTWAAAPMTPDTIRLVQVSVVARQIGNVTGLGETRSLPVNTIAPVVVGDHNPANDAGFNLANYQQFRRRALIRTVDARNLGL